MTNKKIMRKKTKFNKGSDEIPKCILTLDTPEH